MADTTVSYKDAAAADHNELINRISSQDVPYYQLKTEEAGAFVTIVPKVRQLETFTGTASGTTQNISAQGMSKFGLQVTKNGAVVSWTVVLEGSLDGTTFTQIVAHTNVTPGDGLTMWPPGPAAVLYWRLRCSAYGGGGTNIAAIGVALP